MKVVLYDRMNNVNFFYPVHLCRESFVEQLGIHFLYI